MIGILAWDMKMNHEQTLERIWINIGSNRYNSNIWMNRWYNETLMRQYWDVLFLPLVIYFFITIGFLGFIHIGFYFIGFLWIILNLVIIWFREKKRGLGLIRGSFCITRLDLDRVTGRLVDPKCDISKELHIVYDGTDGIIRQRLLITAEPEIRIAVFFDPETDVSLIHISREPFGSTGRVKLIKGCLNLKM